MDKVAFFVFDCCAEFLVACFVYRLTFWLVAGVTLCLHASLVRCGVDDLTLLVGPLATLLLIDSVIHSCIHSLIMSAALLTTTIVSMHTTQEKKQNNLRKKHKGATWTLV